MSQFDCWPDGGRKTGQARNQRMGSWPEGADKAQGDRLVGAWMGVYSILGRAH